MVELLNSQQVRRIQVVLNGKVLRIRQDLEVRFREATSSEPRPWTYWVSEIPELAVTTTASIRCQIYNISTAQLDAKFGKFEKVFLPSAATAQAMTISEDR